MTVASVISRRYDTPRRVATESPPSTAPAPMMARRKPIPPAPAWKVLAAMSGITTWKLKASVPITAIMSNGVRTIRSDHA